MFYDVLRSVTHIIMTAETVGAKFTNGGGVTLIGNWACEKRWLNRRVNFR
jgi:hypothetical protein